MADQILPIERRPNTSPAEIYTQFRRIVQTWNTGRDEQQVMDLFDDIFGGLDPDYYDGFFDDDDTWKIYSDIFHFVANVDNLGPNDMFIPATEIEYLQGDELEILMEQTEEEEQVGSDNDTDMEGAGAGASIQRRRFQNINVDDLSRYSNNQLNDLIMSITAIPVNQRTEHIRRLQMIALGILIRDIRRREERTPPVSDEDSVTSSLDVETEGTGIAPMFLREKRYLDGMKKGVHYGIIGYD